MTCPDGENFAAVLSDCPKTASQSQTQTVVTCSDGSTAATAAECPQYKTCSDGAKIKVGQDCPTPIKYTTCPDGQQVPEGTSCPKYTICPDGQKVPEGTSCPEDNIALCVKKGGMWCASAAGNDKGFCSANGECPTIKQPMPVPPEKLSDRDIKNIQREQKSIMRSLDSLEKSFKKLGDETSMIKIQALKSKVQTTSLDSGALQTLQAVRDEIDILREVLDTLETRGRDATDSERDEAMQKKALAQMKKGVGAFEKRLTALNNRTAALEKQGLVVPAGLKDALRRGIELIKIIKTTQSFDEAQDAAEALRDVSDIINDYLPALEQLGRLPRILNLAQNEINRNAAAVKRLRATAKRLKVDMETAIAELETVLQGMRDALASAKKGEFGDLEPFDFIETNIIDKTGELVDKIATLQSLANLKAAVNAMAARFTRYEARIKLLERQKKDMTEARAVLDEAKEELANLKELAAGKLTDENFAAIKDALNALENLSGELDNLLGMAKRSSLEQELRRKSGANESLKSIELPEVEKLSFNAMRLANFFKSSPLPAWMNLKNPFSTKAGSILIVR